jgi:hypothetical protein
LQTRQRAINGLRCLIRRQLSAVRYSARLAAGANTPAFDLRDRKPLCALRDLELTCVAPSRRLAFRRGDARGVMTHRDGEHWKVSRRIELRSALCRHSSLCFSFAGGAKAEQAPDADAEGLPVGKWFGAQ